MPTALLNAPSLVVSRYLSPKLYVSFGIRALRAGQHGPGSAALLSGEWSLQAESGPGTSGDAIYTIER